MPDISADGKTYKLKLRSGLKYSDGKAVKASDFEHTIKRVLNLESGGVVVLHAGSSAPRSTSRTARRGPTSPAS